ncbi:class I SAM-dependent methyltransferase [soil metagenome]
MRRMQDTFLNNLTTVVELDGTSVLEIGCGDGAQSTRIATHCKLLVAIDPDPALIARAAARGIRNARFLEGTAESLSFLPGSFDVVIFTLSFHHIAQEHMASAIDEALLVVHEDGYIVFLEPGINGSFFDTEIQFDACDGDEGEEKNAAFCAMHGHPGLDLVCELPDETIFQFDSLDDFMRTMKPQKGLDEVEAFLKAHDYTLNATRRISIFRPS